MDGQPINVMKPVVIDCVAFILLGSFNLYVAKFMKPTLRGFYCDDESIRYPRFDSTVPAIVLNIFGIAVPLLIIFIFELKDGQENKKRGTSYVLGSYKLKRTYWNTFRMVAIYASGAVFNQMLTDIGKKVIGRLRPNFIDVCKPDLKALCVPGGHNFIENFTCANSETFVNASRVSFPSGHTSFSFYIAIFLVLYLQKKLKIRTLLLKPIIQFLIIALAWFVALTRVMNNKHHWSDVLSGMLLGTLVAIINTVLVHRLFNFQKSPLYPNKLPAENSADHHEAHEQL